MALEQMWIVEFYKIEYIDRREVLTPQSKIPEVVNNFLQLYPIYRGGDHIKIIPTEMNYYG